ncbi:MAG: efflux RND transporter periplasmic adaptor subunit [Pseudomonadota bacterium]
MTSTRARGVFAASRSLTFHRPVMLACLAASVLVACDSSDEVAAPSVAPPRPVKVMEITRGGGALERVLAATVESGDNQDLSFRVSGAITALPVSVGDRLQAGDLVAELDQQPFVVTEKEARAALAQAEANNTNAQNQYRRSRELYANEAASLSDLENAEANATSAQADRARASESLRSAQLNVSYTRLQNPSDECQVVSVPVAVNQNISAGQTIVTTACGVEKRLTMVVPESLINTIQLGKVVSATTRATDLALSGTVVEIGVSNTDNTGYVVEAVLDAPPADLRVGMAAEVTVSIASGDQRMVVPLTAVLGDSDANYVFVAAADGDAYRIVRTPVTTGPLDNAGIEVVSGLEPGQRIVVAGMSQISEGMRVTLYTGDGR